MMLVITRKTRLRAAGDTCTLAHVFARWASEGAAESGVLKSPSSNPVAGDRRGEIVLVLTRVKKIDIT
jgi:hypothetical protein